MKLARWLLDRLIAPQLRSRAGLGLMVVGLIVVGLVAARIWIRSDQQPACVLGFYGSDATMSIASGPGSTPDCGKLADYFSGLGDMPYTGGRSSGHGHAYVPV